MRQPGHHLNQPEEAVWLRQEGHRLTPQRMLVLSVVKAHCQHMTAEEIYAAVVEQQPFIDIVTVYRTLQWLQSVGLVAPINIGDGLQRYEYHPRGDWHHHLICQGCGIEIQTPDEIFTAMRADILARYGFKVHADHVALHGYCEACLKKDETGDR